MGAGGSAAASASGQRSQSPGNSSSGQQQQQQGSNNKPPSSSKKQQSSPGSKPNVLSGTGSGQLSTPSNSGQLPVLGPARASFVYDAVGPPLDDLVLTPGSASGAAASTGNGGTLARRSTGQPPLPPTAKQQLQQQQQQQRQRLSPDVLEQHASSTGSAGTSSGATATGQQPGESSSGSYAKRVRASMESLGSKASSGGRSGTARSTRSSFALEAAPDEQLQLDAYGRPSFAAFETTLRGKGGLLGVTKQLLLLWAPVR
jgi:hypothetical protein